MLASDVLIEVEGLDEDFNTDDEEQLDYDGEFFEDNQEMRDESPPEEEIFESVEVDSDINFRQKKKAKEPESETLVRPEDLEDYVQRIVDSRWKQKEAELLKKHGLTGNQVKEKGSPQRFTEQLKSPSDTTIYTLALMKTPDKAYKPLTREDIPLNPTVTPEQEPTIDKISNFVESVRLAWTENRLHQGLDPRLSIQRHTDLAIQLLVNRW